MDEYKRCTPHNRYGVTRNTLRMPNDNFQIFFSLYEKPVRLGLCTRLYYTPQRLQNKKRRFSKIQKKPTFPVNQTVRQNALHNFNYKLDKKHLLIYKREEKYFYNTILTMIRFFWYYSWKNHDLVQNLAFVNDKFLDSNIIYSTK